MKSNFVQGANYLCNLRDELKRLKESQEKGFSWETAKQIEAVSGEMETALNSLGFPGCEFDSFRVFLEVSIRAIEGTLGDALGPQQAILLPNGNLLVPREGDDLELIGPDHPEFERWLAVAEKWDDMGPQG